MRGKNLLDVKTVYPDYVNDEGGITYKETTLYKIFETSMLSQYKENTRYTITADYEITGNEGNAVYFYVTYTDGTDAGFWNSLGGVFTGDKSGKVKITTADGKTVKKIALAYSYGYKINVKLTNMQIEEGEEVTPYVPYTGYRKILLENGSLTEAIPTFKGTIIIEIQAEEPVTISGKYKRQEG